MTSCGGDEYHYTCLCILTELCYPYLHVLEFLEREEVERMSCFVLELLEDWLRPYGVVCKAIMVFLKIMVAISCKC